MCLCVISAEIDWWIDGVVRPAAWCDHWFMYWSDVYHRKHHYRCLSCQVRQRHTWWSLSHCCNHDNLLLLFLLLFFIVFLFFIFLVPQEVKITEVKTKIKPSWNGYVSVSSSAGKVSERGLNWTSESRHWSAGIKTVLRAVHQYAQKSCGPGRPETRQMRRLVARVSQLPLADTHKLLTVLCITDSYCEQLVRRRLLLRPSMNRPVWCRL